MVKKGLLEKWKDWRLWAHYVALTGVVFVAHHFSGFLEEMVVAGDQMAWFYLFIWYAVWIALGDQLIHYLFHVFLGWED